MAESYEWSVVQSRSKRPITTDKGSSTSEPNVTKSDPKSRQNATFYHHKTSTPEKTERFTLVQRGRRSEKNDTPQSGHGSRNNTHLTSIEWNHPSQGKSNTSFVKSKHHQEVGEERRDLSSSTNITDSHNSVTSTSSIRLLRRPVKNSSHYSEQAAVSLHRADSDGLDYKKKKKKEKDMVLSKIGQPIIHSGRTQPRNRTERTGCLATERTGCIATDGFDLERSRNLFNHDNGQWDVEYGLSSIESDLADFKMGQERGLLMLKVNSVHCMYMHAYIHMIWLYR